MAIKSIMTWNTSLYVEKTNNIICYKYKSIANEVKIQLGKENSIVFLQEIPYVSNETWVEHSLFSELKKDFPSDKYDIKFNITSKKQIMMTVAIARKGEIKIIDSMINDNRTISINFTGLRITAIHAKNGQYNKRHLTSIDKNDAHITLGDFNAGNYERSENRSLFNSILNNYIDICNQVTTKFNTPIDHVFVAKSIASQCSDVIVNDTIKCSDHFPITFEIDF